MFKKKVTGDNRTTREKGKRAEEIAVKFLKKQGYRILSQNFYAKGGEIDIVAKDGDVIVFVEVRSFKKDMGFNPVETVNKRKLEHLKKAMESFLLKENLYGRADCRFDVIGVIFKEKPEIVHIKDAYRW